LKDKTDLETLRKIRAEFEKAESYLEHLQIKTVSSPPPIIRNEGVRSTGTVTCSVEYTKEVTLQVPFKIEYHALPRLALSAGALVSSVPKRQIGTAPVRTGVGADGIVTTKNVVAITDSARVQTVPFAFLNLRIYERYLHRWYSANLTGGVGVNPNNGSNEVEYFWGVSLGAGVLYLHAGGHSGRFQDPGGGFVLGDTVPASFTGLPVSKRFVHKFAFGISFKIP